MTPEFNPEVLLANPSFLEGAARRKYGIDAHYAIEYCVKAADRPGAAYVGFNTFTGERFQGVVTLEDIREMMLFPGDSVIVDGQNVGKVISIEPGYPMPQVTVEITSRVIVTPDRLLKQK